MHRTLRLHKNFAIICLLSAVLFIPGCFEEVGTGDPGNGNGGEEPWELSEEESAFLDRLREDTFDYFWENANPENGLVHARAPDPPYADIAATGFALSSYPVGVENGYISRSQAAERTHTTLNFLWNAQQGAASSGMTGFRGFFYRFLEIDTGERFENSELSTMDTALLLAGMLSAQSYFDGNSQTELEIRNLADLIYRRVEWQWAYSQFQSPLLSVGWTPENGFIQSAWQGYNEAMLLYILALGSPNNSIRVDSWDRWSSTYQFFSFYGEQYVQYAPLYGHQYSHIWIDFRQIQDSYMRNSGMDYFENSRRATYAHREYAIDNPRDFGEYGPDVWGFTTGDGPADVTRSVNGRSVEFRGYWDRGVGALATRDDGTITPAAAGGSVPFAPEITIPALFNMYRSYGDRIYGEYGFLDAFNPTFTFTDVEMFRGDEVDPEEGWVNGDYVGVNQGPILLMIENYRSGLLWDLMKQNQYVRQGLSRAGFQGGWLAN